MGFFSSKKVEPSLPAPQRGPARVLFSRFYGKSKSAGRSSPPPPDSPYSPASATTLPLSVRTPEPNQSLSFSGRQVSADALTMSLAQRLNELAIANADGLLNDDEYRLLRQNIFERYAVGADPATEPHIVSKPNGINNRRLSPSLKRTPSVSSNRSISTAVSSLFRRSTNRSVLSPTASTAGSIFSTQQQMSPMADSASVLSSPSRRPSISSRSPYSASVSHGLSRKPSDESLISNPHANATPASLTNDMRGIIYRHNIIGNASTHYASSTSSRVTTRSSKPPSSFNLRHPGLRQPYSRTHEEDEDEDHPKSPAELHEEIETLESEWRKLHDAFNGLELSALTKSRSSATSVPLNAISEVPQHRVGIYPESASASALGSAYTLIPNRAGSLHVARNHVPPVKQPVSLKRKPSVVNSIASSIKSSTTDLRNNLLAPAAPSLHSTRSSPNLNASLLSAPAPALATTHSVPGNHHHSPARPTVVLNGSSPPTAPPATHASPPMLHHTNGLVDPALHEVEMELADIRRRKADVSMRYERRLEFLRAKLKAAEIRERLIKK